MWGWWIHWRTFNLSRESDVGTIRLDYLHSRSSSLFSNLSGKRFHFFAYKFTACLKPPSGDHHLKTPYRRSSQRFWNFLCTNDQHRYCCQNHYLKPPSRDHHLKTLYRRSQQTFWNFLGTNDQHHYCCQNQYLVKKKGLINKKKKFKIPLNRISEWEI